MLETNKIYHGDSFELCEQIEEGVVDVILEDMPYNTIACDWDVKIDLDLYWKTRLRILKPNGVVILTGTQPFVTDLINSNRKMFKYEWIWNKINGPNFMNIANRPFKTHENILIFSNIANFTFNPIPTPRTESSLQRYPIGKEHEIHKEKNTTENHYKIKTTNAIIRSDGLKHPIDILTFTNYGKGRYNGFTHPTRKPVALFEYLIRTYSNEGDLIFDGFGGSGTSAIAAHKSKRNFIVIEKEKKYFDCSIKRLKLEQMQLTLEEGNE